MFNHGYKKREMKKLEEAYKSTKSKIDEVGERCIALAVLRSQSSIKIISNFEKHLNSSTRSNRLLSNTLEDFKGQFSVFTSEIYENAVDEKSDNHDETLLEPSMDYMPSIKMAFDTTLNFSEDNLIGTVMSSYQAAVSDKDKSIVKKESFQVGGLGMLGASLLGGPLGWGIGLGTVIASGKIASTENKAKAEEANQLHLKYIEIDKLLELALIEINELIEHTNSEYQAYENTFKELLLEQNEDNIQTDTADNSFITALVKHVTTLSVLLSQKVDL